MTGSEHDFAAQPAAADKPLGARLRIAREARALSTQDVARALRARLAIVEAIEADDFDRLGAPVFMRGYLNSYAKLVGLPPAVVDIALAERAEPPPAPLQTSVHTPRSRYLLDRYARRGAYLVLTVSIVGPLVFMATREQLPVEQLGLRSLDAPAQIQGAASPWAADDEAPALAGVPAADEDDTADVTVVASMTPFYGQRSTPRAAEAPTADVRADPAPAAAVADGWVLRLAADSWVEITDVDGRRLEFGLLTAGSERHYPAGRIASVALGNAGGATLLRNGEPLDLQPYKRANVARFTVSSDGQLRPGT